MEMKEYIREFTLKDIVTVRNPKVVALGGGTGLSVILRGLKKYTNRLTAIVTVGDDGGSSGMLRQDLGILPPGDIRTVFWRWPTMRMLCSLCSITALPKADWRGTTLGTCSWQP